MNVYDFGLSWFCRLLAKGFGEMTISNVFYSEIFIYIFFIFTGLHNPIDAIYHFQPVMALTMVLFAVAMEGKIQNEK